MEDRLGLFINIGGTALFVVGLRGLHAHIRGACDIPEPRKTRDTPTLIPLLYYSFYIAARLSPAAYSPGRRGRCIYEPRV